MNLEIYKHLFMSLFFVSFGLGFLAYFVFDIFNISLRRSKELNLLNKQSKEFIVQYLIFKESLYTTKKLKIIIPKEPTKQKELPNAYEL